MTKYRIELREAIPETNIKWKKHGFIEFDNNTATAKEIMRNLEDIKEEYDEHDSA